MTPAEHATAATDLLAATRHVDVAILPETVLEEITAHAILSHATGTGTHYDTADQLLANAAAAKNTALASWGREVRLALVHAHLADH